MPFWPLIPWNAQRHVDDTIARKRLARESAIREALEVIGSSRTDEEDYLRASATEIASQVRSKRWKSEEVLKAYIRSAIRAHHNTNCLTEILFLDALAQARALDEWIADTATPEQLGYRLLIGVPVSLKDQIDVKGYDSSIGFAKYCNEPAQEDALIVTLLRSQGAIPFCKTNVPQTMLAFECANPVFGRTSNPYSPLHVPGGSSGGEAALLASDGSPLGIGSDIGGSLRIPAHYSGCFGLKPIVGRFPGKGCRGSAPGYEAIKTTLGPMGRSVQDMELCMRAVSRASMDAHIHRTQGPISPVPFREVELPKKLRLGYFIDDGFIPTSPACERAVTMSVEACRKAGHECVPIVLPKVLEAFEAFSALGSSDGYYTLMSHLLPKEPREPALFLTTLGPRLPSFIRPALAWLVGSVMGEKAMARLFMLSREKRVREVYRWQNTRMEIAEEIKGYLWEEMKLDGVLCPVQASPATPHGATKQLSPLAIQTIIWNVVESSAGVVPVTRVDADRDALPPSFIDKIKGAATRALSKLLYSEVYQPTSMHGLPVGVQVVAPPWEEEQLLKIMTVVDEAVKQHIEGARRDAFGPGTFIARSAQHSNGKVY